MERKSENEQEREAERSRVNVAREKMGRRRAEGRSILAKERREKERVENDVRVRGGEQRATAKARLKCGSRRGRAVDIEFIGCRVATVRGSVLKHASTTFCRANASAESAGTLGFDLLRSESDDASVWHQGPAGSRDCGSRFRRTSVRKVSAVLHNRTPLGLPLRCSRTL